MENADNHTQKYKLFESLQNQDIKTFQTLLGDVNNQFWDLKDDSGYTGKIYK